MRLDEDTQRLSGGFRTIEAKIRMIKERNDKKKYTDKEFWKVLSLLTPSDGFTQEQIDFFKAVNKISGSLAHGNYAEAIQKMDEFIVPVYFKDFKPKKDSVKKIDLSGKTTGAEILGAILNAQRTPVAPNEESDIYEAYLVAKTWGYVELMDQLIAGGMQIINSRLDGRP